MTASHRLKAAMRFHWPALVVLVVAALYRFVNLFPTFLYGDAAEYATVARYLAEDPRRLQYPDLEHYGPVPFVSQPPLLLYVFALAGKAVGSVAAGAILTSALLGTLTCVLVYAIMQPVAGRLAGMLGGLFLAVLPLHVNLSRKAMLDPGFTFFFTLTLWTFVVWHRKRTIRWAALTGVAAAATCLSKLPGFLVLPALAVGFLATLRAASIHHEQDRRVLVAHGMWALLPVAVGGFLYLILLWYLHGVQDLVDKLLWQGSRISGTQVGDSLATNRGRPWHWYLAAPGQGLWSQMGPPLLVLAFAGLLFQYRWRRSEAGRLTLTLLTAATFSVALFFFASHRKQAFYLLPLLPLLCAWAALPSAGALRWIWDRLPVPSRPLHAGAPISVAVVAFVVFAGLPTAQSTSSEVFRPDTYGAGVPEAAVWIHERDPSAAQIGTLLGRFGLHYYNQQTTYHWYVPHPFVEGEIQRGHVRFVVLDTYFNSEKEQAWMNGLVSKYHGELVFIHPPASSEPRVRVYQLNPDHDNR